VTEIVRFETEDGLELLVETDDSFGIDEFGDDQVSRGDDGVVKAARRLESVMNDTMGSLRPVVDAVRKLAPSEYEIEFGMKLNSEAGVLLAKTALEGHFTVKLAWRSPDAANPETGIAT
jgi:Trypsin-co-occurring domain 1